LCQPIPVQFEIHILRHHRLADKRVAQIMPVGNSRVEFSSGTAKHHFFVRIRKKQLAERTSGSPEAAWQHVHDESLSD